MVWRDVSTWHEKKNKSMVVNPHAVVLFDFIIIVWLIVCKNFDTPNVTDELNKCRSYARKNLASMTDKM